MTQAAIASEPAPPLPIAAGRKLKMDAGELSEHWRLALPALEQALAAGALKVLKVAPSDLEEAAMEPSSWSVGSRLPALWKRMLLVSAYADDGIALKVFRPGAWYRRCYYQLPGCDPYRKAFAFHRRLESSPIKSVRALAHGKVLNRGLLHFSFFAMERLSEVQTISDFLESFIGSTTAADSARARVRDYSAIRLAEMHRHGFFHKDIKPYHCWVPSSSANDSPSLQSGPWIWVDLDRCRLHAHVTMRERIINLYQFWRYILKPLGEDDCAAFVAKYLQHSPEVKAGVEEVSARVLSHFEKRIVRAMARGRLR